MDFLVSKGFSKDDLKPTSKIVRESIAIALYSRNSKGDKVAKHKSDLTDLLKGSLEAKKKRRGALQQQSAATGYTAFQERGPVVKKQCKGRTARTRVVEETPPPAPACGGSSARRTRSHKSRSARNWKVQKPPTRSISLLSTRPPAPKKARKRRWKRKKTGYTKHDRQNLLAEPVSQQETPVPAPTTREEVPAVEDTRDTSNVSAEETTETVASTPTGEDACRDRSTGRSSHDPEQLEERAAGRSQDLAGKIDLPINSDTRPKAPSDEKRKRKRIPIEKKDHSGGGGRPGQQGGGAPHGGSQQGGPGNPRQPGHQRPPLQRNTGGNRGPGGAGQGHGGAARRPDPRHAPREAKEIDKKEIQEKIRQTQAKLAGSG